MPLSPPGQSQDDAIAHAVSARGRHGGHLAASPFTGQRPPEVTKLRRVKAPHPAPHPAPPPAPLAIASPWTWSNSFASLGPNFSTELPPAALPSPSWGAVSPSCAAELGLPKDWWQREDWQALEVCSGNRQWPGMQPLASVYSGHQFGVWAGQLGDGRALLLGEANTSAGPREIQLKGSGLTPYSRMGDGRAVLRSTVREFLCSEAMHGLGIPTTREIGRAHV